jgi:hypothetical protein
MWIHLEQAQIELGWVRLEKVEKAEDHMQSDTKLI